MQTDRSSQDTRGSQDNPLGLLQPWQGFAKIALVNTIHVDINDARLDLVNLGGPRLGQPLAARRAPDSQPARIRPSPSWNLERNLACFLARQQLRNARYRRHCSVGAEIMHSASASASAAGWPSIASTTVPGLRLFASSDASSGTCVITNRPWIQSHDNGRVALDAPGALAMVTLP